MSFLGRLVPCSDEFRNTATMDQKLSVLFLILYLMVDCSRSMYFCFMDLYLPCQRLISFFSWLISSAMIYNYMKKLDEVFKTRMQKAALNVYRGLRTKNPIAKRTMKKLDQPRRIGS